MIAMQKKFCNKEQLGHSAKHFLLNNQRQALHLQMNDSFKRSKRLPGSRTAPEAGVWL